MAEHQTDDASLAAALRHLANKWALKARDHARESKTRNANSDIATANYHRGIAETYYKLAMELADLVTRETESEPAGARAPEGGTSAPSDGGAPETIYAEVPLSEAMTILDYAGVSARDVSRHKDNVFTAVFSRWQPFSEAERIEKIKRADMRIVIMGSGKLQDTGDPYVEFAFRDQPSR